MTRSQAMAKLISGAQASMNAKFKAVHSLLTEIFADMDGTNVYSVIMSQESTNAPEVDSEGLNTIGDIVWTREAIGTYKGTLADAFRGVLVGSGDVLNSNGDITYSLTKFSDDAVILQTAADGVVADDLLQEAQILIEVTVPPAE